MKHPDHQKRLDDAASTEMQTTGNGGKARPFALEVIMHLPGSPVGRDTFVFKNHYPSEKARDQARAAFKRKRGPAGIHYTTRPL